jgi:radical SAM-linked protein
VPGSDASAPIGTRLRVRYAKTGKLRFVSAIDLGRLWERGLRRADLPIAYSEGFSPHPKVSFADALPLGYASTGEYAELQFAAPVDVTWALERLNDAFPDGLAVLDAIAVDEQAPRLGRLLRASCWDLRYPPGAAGLDAAGEAVLAAAELPVARERKGVVTHVDLRPAIFDLQTRDDTVRVVLHHVEPAVRPTEVDQALRSLLSALPHLSDALPPPALVTRVAQGSAGDDGLIEALRGTLVPRAPDRVPVPPRA